MKRLATLALAAVVIAGCGGGGHSAPKVPVKESIGGHVTVKDVVPGLHKSCAPKWLGQNDDIEAGTQLVIRNASGTVIASTALFGGQLVGSSIADYGCRYSWFASVPKSAFYQLRIANYNQVTVTSADAVAFDGNLSVDAN